MRCFGVVVVVFTSRFPPFATADASLSFLLQFLLPVLDALVQLHVVLGDKGDGFTSATGSGCAPHSMDVIL